MIGGPTYEPAAAVHTFRGGATGPRAGRANVTALKTLSWKLQCASANSIPCINISTKKYKIRTIYESGTIPTNGARGRRQSMPMTEEPLRALRVADRAEKPLHFMKLVCCHFLLNILLKR